MTTEAPAPLEGASPTPPPNRGGRPPKWNAEELEELRAAILEGMSEGETVGAMCDRLGVSRAQLYRWTESDSRFGDAFARARVAQAHALAERALDEALSLELSGGPGDTALVQAARLRADTLKWYASKMAPRLYGEHKQEESRREVVIRVVRDPLPDTLPPGATMAALAPADAEWETVEEGPGAEVHTGQQDSPAPTGSITLIMSSAPSPVAHLGAALSELEGMEHQLAELDGGRPSPAELAAALEAVRSHLGDGEPGHTVPE